MKDFRHYELLDSIDETLWKLDCLDYYHTQKEVECVFMAYLKPRTQRMCKIKTNKDGFILKVNFI